MHSASIARSISCKQPTAYWAAEKIVPLGSGSGARKRETKLISVTSRSDRKEENGAYGGSRSEPELSLHLSRLTLHTTSDNILELHGETNKRLNKGDIEMRTH